MKSIKFIFLPIIMFLFILQVNALDFEIKSDKAILINTTDNIVLYEKNSNVKTSIASLTKIITAITVLDNIENLDDEVIINYQMLRGLDGYAKAGFKVGNEATIEELLYALILPSGADAAQILAIYTSGNIENFVKLMNEEITKIGVENSHFTNPVGMDNDENYSTAKDLSIILEYCLKNDTFKKIYESDEFYITALNKKVKSTIKTTSESYNLDTSIIKGSKTGWTTNAGRCLATTSNFNGTDYLLVVLNADELTLDHITDTINIYNFYKENYGYKTILNNGDLLYKLKVKDSKQKEYSIISKEDVTLYLKNDISTDNIEISFNGVEYIGKDIKKDDFLGKINILYEDEIIYSTDIYLDENIKFYNYKLYIGIGLLLFIISIIILYKFIKKIK